MMDVQTRVGMPMDEFIRQYEQQPFELINGERIGIVPNVATHSEIIRLLLFLLFALKDFVTYPETPFVLVDKADWVKGSRVPDILGYHAARLAAYKQNDPDWGKKPFALVPDLCVEVISPNDNYGDIDDKVAVYLEDGVRLVWVINPRNQTIRVFTAGSNQSVTLKAADTLTGGDVLPGFAARVSALFPE